MAEKNCITQVMNSVLGLLGLNLQMDEKIAPPLQDLLLKAEEKFNGQKCDRVFMYNPDAIARWIYKKYQKKFTSLENLADLKIDMTSVVPPVTPVCFASMYSGLQPEIHGIKEYVKPVLTCNTLFDYLSAAGKKVAIVSTEGDSISLIFLNRKIDYFIYKTKTECNNKAKELIKEDKYDVIVLYNGDYDYFMHRFTPEGFPALRALKQNINTYCELYQEIKQNWKSHKTALAFAMDHGCHYSFPLPGNHGKDIPKDMEIEHFWSFI